MCFKRGGTRKVARHGLACLLCSAWKGSTPTATHTYTIHAPPPDRLQRTCTQTRQAPPPITHQVGDGRHRVAGLHCRPPELRLLAPMKTKKINKNTRLQITGCEQKSVRAAECMPGHDPAEGPCEATAVLPGNAPASDHPGRQVGFDACQLPRNDHALTSMPASHRNSRPVRWPWREHQGPCLFFLNTLFCVAPTCLPLRPTSARGLIMKKP